MSSVTVHELVPSVTVTVPVGAPDPLAGATCTAMESCPPAVGLDVEVMVVTVGAFGVVKDSTLPLLVPPAFVPRAW